MIHSSRTGAATDQVSMKISCYSFGIIPVLVVNGSETKHFSSLSGTAITGLQRLLGKMFPTDYFLILNIKQYLNLAGTISDGP